ncbi:MULTISPECIES: ABC transporter ATP-binding protein [Mumia]|uniref:ABC transporter ATP-binding protein n=1 Tax=Mumia TaxID=1546255 RepID=UPI0014226D9F|nr:ABC transporter ATP-binding protein [Mumia sp. ZJ1417]QMW65545.1 ABC transporter ATP-binding protein [Mumia sp. ZJ1417]
MVPAQTASPLLRLDDLSKSFGQVVVADGLDLVVGTGETLGIVGPNGAGKTSLFAMISGDLAPDSGRVVLEGVDVTAMAPHRRARAGLGRTYQIPRPFEGMTVFENVLVAATEAAGLRGRAAADAAMEVLERAGLLPVANTRGGALTLLQRKRLEVARGLAAAPKVLLLDEVAGGLTEPEVVELVALVRAVNASGVAIVWIEHVVHALTATVDRLACLAGGRLVADGEPSAVLADPTVRELYLGHAVTVEGDVA